MFSHRTAKPFSEQSQTWDLGHQGRFPALSAFCPHSLPLLPSLGPSAGSAARCLTVPDLPSAHAPPSWPRPPHVGRARRMAHSRSPSLGLSPHSGAHWPAHPCPPPPPQTVLPTSTALLLSMTLPFGPVTSHSWGLHSSVSSWASVSHHRWGLSKGSERPLVLLNDWSPQTRGRRCVQR